MKLKGFYFVTDRRLSKAGNIKDVRNALKAGVQVVQYREKSASTKELFIRALALRRICKNTIFIVNDRADIALAVGADGVHLGSSDMPYSAARKILGPRKIIGLTVHNLKEAINAQKQGADYLGVAPVFPTATKVDAGNPCGVKLVKRIKKAVRIPVVAIGGIKLSNARQVIDAGADCICAISAVVAKRDVKKEILSFKKLFKNNG